MTKVGRNDLCPCGSGKKHKKCCGKSNIISIEHLVDNELKELQVDIMNFGLENYEEDINVFLGDWLEEYESTIPEEAFDMFYFFSTTCFIASIEIKGKTILQHYIDTRLSKWTRQRTKDILLSWKLAKPSVTIIIDQDDSGLLTLQDIFTDEQFKVKVLDDDHPVETGGIVLGIILPAGETSIFFTSFIDLPASSTENVKNNVIQLFEESKESNHSEYLSLYYPEILYLFVFGTEPSLEELDWNSPKHLEVAQGFKDYMEDIQDDVFIKLGIHLWYQYCSRKNPKVMKTNLYTAALIYLVDQINPFGEMLTQNELAKEFGTSSSSLSTKYRDMDRVLSDEIQDLVDTLDNFDYDDDLGDRDGQEMLSSNFSSERELLKLESEMGKHSFESMEEINDFLNQRLNKSESQNRELTDKEKAQEYIFDAYESTGDKRTQLAKRALELYPNSPDAYTILADAEFNPNKEEKLLLKAIEVGEKELGRGFFEENQGHFWGIVSTRPYMRAKYNYAYLLLDTGRLIEAMKQYEEMLELNPNDNQGVRYELFTVFVEIGLFKKAEALLDRFDEDMTAHGAYNRVLIEFLQNGVTSRAKALLQKAIKQNPYVPDYLLDKKELPLYIPPDYQIGEESEAVIYVDQYFLIWENNPPLMRWLKKETK